MSTKAQNLPVDVDQIIEKLLHSKGRSVQIAEDKVKHVCAKARQIFKNEPSLLTIKAPLKICGDIHGQFKDLLRIFRKGGLPSSSQRYLFLGDYVDRGKNSLECILLLLCLKIKYPENVFMLRGNHECSYINRMYGFYDECKRRLNIKIFKNFTDLFNYLPLAAVISKRIFCMHGGLSPEITKYSEVLKIQRPSEVPEEGLICDLLWSDPDPDTPGFSENIQRGVGHTFGRDVIEKFIKDNDLDVICRAHQVVQEGFEFFGNRRLVTVFSAPNYCGQFDNDGAFMTVDPKLVCSFSVIKSKDNKENETELSIAQKSKENPERLSTQEDDHESLEKTQLGLKEKILNKVK